MLTRNPKKKKKKDDLKIANVPDLGSYDLRVPKGMDPRSMQLPNADRMMQKLLDKKKNKNSGVSLPPV